MNFNLELAAQYLYKETPPSLPIKQFIVLILEPTIGILYILF